MYFHQFFQCIHSRVENKVQRIYATNFFSNISNIVNKIIFIWLFIYFNTVWIKIFYIATNQAKYMFLEYSWNIPMIYSWNIWKTFPWNSGEYSLRHIPGILNIRIFPGECSGNTECWNIPWMFHEYPTNVTCIFLGGSRNTIVDEAVSDIRWVSLEI